MNLYELKMSLKTVGDQLAKVEGDIVANAGDPSTPIEEVQNLKKKKEETQERFNILKTQHDELEAKQQLQFENKKPLVGGLEDPKAKKVAAKAEMVRATMQNRTLSDEAKAILGDRNNTGGEKLLPKTVSDELLFEPFVKNPLRDVSTFTNETNLEVPKITFTLSDDDFIADTETAKEMQAEGDNVVFGRYKFKVFVPISETILKGSDTNLVETVDQALESGLAAKEKKVAFAATPKTGEEHMSFYSTQNAIKVVNGANKLQAIRKAIADLHEDYRDNAKVMMTYADYSEMIESLAAGNTTFYDAPPERVLGKPVIFSDSATDPIVGDFRYSHFNYDIEMLKDRDKDVKTGIELFVLTAWIDHRIKLKSAFRIAKVTAPTV
ncbi:MULTISPECIES: phage major capsid protein [unclassified Bacillus (in: firmicutes)]|uniref:phage major capsid protein n=1 Tax=unclassified Bacillus (in: firmicutes) TaxID=185979 RepID=UPI001BE90082|nr:MULTISPECIES: phage major capsid protein [unclassified Bacillus (in: firmicutes)]MBT2614130.1 phage major capsid protein [Bacillus sp. ISL-78]MBT2629359.1 phage major capsid protein [Bacillus sp. ISL-101]